MFQCAPSVERIQTINLSHLTINLSKIYASFPLPFMFNDDNLEGHSVGRVLRWAATHWALSRKLTG